MQFRNYLPKTLFGRMLSIIMIPMILVQLLTIFIFYERHWDTVTRHMASQLAADISLLTDRLGSAPDEATVTGRPGPPAFPGLPRPGEPRPI